MFLLQLSSTDNSHALAKVTEMQYRVAVSYQNRAWDKGSMELVRLLETMKQEECRRRINLRELLVAFVQRQQRLFLSLPPIHNPILEELAELKLDRDEIEKEVQTAIRDRALGLRRTKESSLEQVTEEEGDFSLESPLSSEQLRHAKVVERRTAGGKIGWKTSLATVTADSHMHLFDLPTGRIQLGASSETAFNMLIPTVFVPSLENLKAGKSNFSKGWSDPICPSETILLGNCFLESRGDTSFDITETVATNAASKLLGKKSSRKISIKTNSKKDTEEFMSILKTPV